MSEETAFVKTYSGRTYAERPMSFVWRAREYQIVEIEKEWLEPGRRHFNVCTQDSTRFHLWYEEAIDRWSLATRR